MRQICLPSLNSYLCLEVILYLMTLSFSNFTKGELTKFVDFTFCLSFNMPERANLGLVQWQPTVSEAFCMFK